MFERKVFGIGFQKTATTSLQEALNIIGFPGVHWAYYIWHEITLGNERFPLIDQVASVTDFPIPLIYKRLDKGYPGSKFILTVRDSESWIKSVENHFTIMDTPLERLGGISIHDKMREQGVPADAVHEAIYGSQVFDKAKFLEAYEAHNADVRDYFKGRPGDLLVMEMEKGDEWGQLCPFLGVSVPPVPYPKAHKTNEREPGTKITNLRS